MKKVIKTEMAPAAVGPYEQGMQAGNLIFTSGQIPLTKDGVMVEGDIKAQTMQAILNVQAILAEAGVTLADVVKTTVFITDMASFGAVNEVYGEFFAQGKPARSCVEVGALPKGALVEIEAIAVKAEV